MPYNIDISGDNNTTSLVIASSNSSINAGGDTMLDYIKDIQDYIRTTLATSLTNQFLNNNNLAIRDKTAILDNIELCWVGEPETFYQDVSNLDIQNNGAKIFSHFTEIVKQHSINLQTLDGSFVSIQFSLTPDIFSKIQYVNSKVPENLKKTNQGYHTLGLINNNIRFPISGVPKYVKTILTSEGFGIYRSNYYGLLAYINNIQLYDFQILAIQDNGQLANILGDNFNKGDVFYDGVMTVSGEDVISICKKYTSNNDLQDPNTDYGKTNTNYGTTVTNTYPITNLTSILMYTTNIPYERLSKQYIVLSIDYNGNKLSAPVDYLDQWKINSYITFKITIQTT